MADYQKKTAYKLKIGDLIKGKYIKKEGWDPSYIVGTNGTEISRVNIIALIVDKQESTPESPSIILDDGSGKVEVKAFSDSEYFANVNVGDLVLVIGRPREYNKQIFITPEIVKKIQNPKWMEVRKVELKGIDIIEEKDQLESEEEKTTHKPANLKEGKESIKEEQIIDSEEDEIQENPSQKVFNLIKDLDEGGGVEYDQIIKTSGLENAEKIISNLLSEGDIFEIKNGRLKVLE